MSLAIVHNLMCGRVIKALLLSKVILVNVVKTLDVFGDI